MMCIQVKKRNDSCFDMDHFLKVCVEFVTVLLLIYVLVFWLGDMWGLSSLIRDGTCAPAKGLPGKSETTRILILCLTISLTSSWKSSLTVIMKNVTVIKRMISDEHSLERSFALQSSADLHSWNCM